MYRYDAFDETIIRERVVQFREQVARRIRGEISEEVFKPLRLMNGVYLQLHAYMLRVAIPYGTLDSRQLRHLAFIADTYDRGFGHFTTRQNIQFNWPSLVDIPEILDHLADVGMHAVQTSGNCIRNVTSDHFAGAIDGEIEDPRPWAEMIRQWSSFHPEFSYLPRKFKIAVTASTDDRAAIRFHDIGLELYRNANAKPGFRVYVGGGMGRTPYIGQVIRDFLPKNSLLSYLESIIRIYNLEGRRDNSYKARIKILVNAIGIEAFREKVETHWATLDKTLIDIPIEEQQRIEACFAPPVFEQIDVACADFTKAMAAHKGFAQWARQNTQTHKIPGYAVTTLTLKAAHMAPGDATSGQMRLIADLAERYSFDELRVSHEQNLILPHVKKSHLFELWQELEKAGLATANSGLVSDIIACPGLDYCNLANTRSIPLANRLQEHFSDATLASEIGELKIKISGCINACGHHHAGHIGILGVDKKGEEFYQITLGGSADEDAAIGDIVGRGLSTDEVVTAIAKVIEYYRATRRDDEPFLQTYRRLGAAPFKELLYDTA